jgi:transposase
MGRLAEAWIAPAEIRELREITRYRGKLVQLRTSCKDQVHGVLAKLGIEVTCSDIFGAWGTRWLDELVLPQPYSWKVASLRQLVGWLSAEITVLEQVTADLLAGHDGYRAVQQLPGIGPVLGAVIVAEIGGIGQRVAPDGSGPPVVACGACQPAALDVSRRFKRAHLVPGGVLAHAEDVAGDFDRAVVEISAHQLPRRRRG